MIGFGNAAMRLLLAGIRSTECCTPLDVVCAVIAPFSLPRRTVDRITTDRHDAAKRAQYYVADLLTVIGDLTMHGSVRTPSCADGPPSFKINPGPSCASLFCCKAEVLYAGQAGTGRNSSGVGFPFAPDDNEAFTLGTPVDMLHARIRPVAPRIATIAQTPRSPRRVPER